MAMLTARSRDKLSNDQFALPGRRYPIHDVSHAQNALARVSEYGTPEEKEAVRKAVCARYKQLCSDS